MEWFRNDMAGGKPCWGHGNEKNKKMELTWMARIFRIRKESFRSVC